MKNFLALGPQPLALLLLPCALLAQTTSRRVDGVAAYVNNHTITIADVWREMPPNVPAAEEDEVFAVILNAMVDAKLILDEARATNMQMPAWAVDARVQEIMDRNFKGDHDLLAAELVRARKTQEGWRRELEEEMIVQSMRIHHIERTLVVPPKDVRAHYAANAAEFVAPEKTDVSMLVAQGIEEDALAQIAAAGKPDPKVPFATLAQTLQAGDIGKITVSNMGFILPAEDLRPELADAVAKLADGQYSPMLILDGVGYILSRNATEPARQIPLEEAWPFIETHLRNQLGRERFQAWVEMLRRKSHVQIVK